MIDEQLKYLLTAIMKNSDKDICASFVQKLKLIEACKIVFLAYISESKYNRISCVCCLNSSALRLSIVVKIRGKYKTGDLSRDY